MEQVLFFTQIIIWWVWTQKWVTGLCQVGCGRVKYWKEILFFLIHKALTCTLPLHVRVLSVYHSLLYSLPSPLLAAVWKQQRRMQLLYLLLLAGAKCLKDHKIIIHSLHKHGVNIFARNLCSMQKKKFVE